MFSILALLVHLLLFVVTTTPFLELPLLALLARTLLFGSILLHVQLFGLARQGQDQCRACLESDHLIQRLVAELVLLHQQFKIYVVQLRSVRVRR